MPSAPLSSQLVGRFVSALALISVSLYASDDVSEAIRDVRKLLRVLPRPLMYTVRRLEVCPDNSVLCRSSGRLRRSSLAAYTSSLHHHCITSSCPTQRLPFVFQLLLLPLGTTSLDLILVQLLLDRLLRSDAPHLASKEGNLAPWCLTSNIRSHGDAHHEDMMSSHIQHRIVDCTLLRRYQSQGTDLRGQSGLDFHIHTVLWIEMCVQTSTGL